MILGIIGLGLMGGSFALSCKQNYNFTKIVGIDHNKEHCKVALELNLIDEIIEFAELSKCDVIVISVPICAIICTLEKLSKINLKENVKMNIKIMNAHEHDRHAAFISHMPHIVSYSLTNSVLKQEDKNHIITLAAGGFRSMARLAKSNPAMWKDIFESNEKNLLDAIDAFSEELKLAKELIEKKEYKELCKWMKEGNKLHEIL